MEKQHVILDATVLSTLMSCPRKADLRFNKLWVPKEKANALEAGSLCHIILEFTNKALIAGKSRQDAIEIGYIAGKEWLVGEYRENNTYLKADTEYATEKFINQEESDKSNIGWKFCFDTMEQYFDYWRNDSFTLIEVESVRTETIYEDDEIIVGWKCKYDNIIDMSNGMLPRDYKTMKQRRDTNSNNVQFMGQCVNAKSRSMMIDKIGFQTSLKPHEKFERAIINYTFDRLEEFKTEIVPHYARMLLAYAEADNYPPNFSQCENKYGACEFYRGEVCNSDRRMREETLNVYFRKGAKWDPTND